MSKQPKGWILGEFQSPIDGRFCVAILTPKTTNRKTGDMMQVWSNDRYRSAEHRVVRHPAGKSRYSTPFFYNPHSKTAIRPLAEFGAPRFEPFAWSDYIGGRVADNYADIGEDDIQIDRFRIA